MKLHKYYIKDVVWIVCPYSDTLIVLQNIVKNPKQRLQTIQRLPHQVIMFTNKFRSVSIRTDCVIIKIGVTCEIPK